MTKHNRKIFQSITSQSRWTVLAAALMATLHSGCGSEADDDGFATPTAVPTLAPGQTPTPVPTPIPDNHIHPLGVSSAILEGGNASDYLGASVAVTGDLNGDGVDDIAVGAPGEDSAQPEAGLVGVLFGSLDGIESGMMSFPASFTGEGRGDGAGQAVVSAGDLNGDGLADLLIGAPNQDTGGTDSGRVYAIFGRTSGWYPKMRLSDANFSIFGDPGERLGQGGSVAGGGDLNGDGYDDIAIGSPFVEASAFESGRVYIIPGQKEGQSEEVLVSDVAFTLDGEGEQNWAGFSVNFVPDLNGDGCDELLVGAPHAGPNYLNQGVVYLWMGRKTLPIGNVPLSNAEIRLLGATDGEEAGASVASAGDMDYDGVTDLLIGAWGETDNDSNGRFYIAAMDGDLAPGTKEKDKDLKYASTSIHGTGAFEYLGRPGTGVGDVNGDGFDDILLGTALGNEALLFMGQGVELPARLASNDADHLFVGNQANDSAGSSVAGGGDINADGLPDFLVGAILADNRSTFDGGAVYVLYGTEKWLPASR